MAYSDNYPNGYKSGYDSWDDPDRKDYSPYGEERARREAGSGIREETSGNKYWENVRRRQTEREYQSSQEIETRKRCNERREKEYEAAAIMRSEVLEAYRKQSWFKRFVAKRKGNDPYSRQSEIFHEAVEQAKTMSDRELDDIIRSGRTR